jgi:hypothetical protein
MEKIHRMLIAKLLIANSLLAPEEIQTRHKLLLLDQAYCLLARGCSPLRERQGLRCALQRR